MSTGSSSVSSLIPGFASLFLFDHQMLSVLRLKLSEFSICLNLFLTILSLLLVPRGIVCLVKRYVHV